MQGIELYAENTETSAVTSEFLDEHYDLVKKIVWQIKRKLPSFIDIDDLMQAGFIGLIQAKQNYQTDKEASFKTYASIRIQGAIIDEVRRISWGGRDVAKYIREINEATHKLEQRLFRTPTQLEIANEMGLEIDEYNDICQLISMNQVISSEYSDDFADELDENPSVQYEEDDLVQFIKEHIATLTPREQQILSMYYIEEFMFKEIAEVLELTEARVCQLHTKIIQGLRAKVMCEDE